MLVMPFGGEGGGGRGGREAWSTAKGPLIGATLQKRRHSGVISRVDALRQLKLITLAKPSMVQISGARRGCCFSTTLGGGREEGEEEEWKA